MASDFIPKDGDKVLIRTGIAVYEKQGYYQFNVKEIQPDGIGALHLAFEELKRKLHAEGLFDEAHKKPIPPYPKVIGLVTSGTGAAVQDMVTTIKRRYPIARILLTPVLVQGTGAAESIARAIELHNNHGEADVLLVGRGGGSLEDLWSFNEEIVARAIFASTIPIISAVGHEVDFTIADFVADLRAPTPTAAAEHATPLLSELKEYNQDLQKQLIRSLQHLLQRSKDKHEHTYQNLLFRHPKRLWETSVQDLDLLTERLQKTTLSHLNRSTVTIDNLQKRLDVQKPTRLLKEKKEFLLNTHTSLINQMDRFYTQKRHQFERIADKLDALSPIKTMNRGYSIVRQSGIVVKSIDDIQVGQEVSVNLKDGTFTSVINSKQGE